jgi:hypothetical protein
MNSEEYLARKYCEPQPYWHCLRELSGGDYSFNELNFPEYWLNAVAKYIQGKPSAAVKQLYRRVEVARAEFKAKQERASGSGGVDRATFEKKELSAWNTFTAQKQACLKDYLKAIRTGQIEKQRATRRHRCQGGDCRELLTGRATFCNICKRGRNREAARVYRRRNQSCSVISYTREIRPKNGAVGYLDSPYRKSCGSRQGKAGVFTVDRRSTMAQTSSAGNRDFVRRDTSGVDQACT